MTVFLLSLIAGLIIGYALGRSIGWLTIPILLLFHTYANADTGIKFHNNGPGENYVENWTGSYWQGLPGVVAEGGTVCYANGNDPPSRQFRWYGCSGTTLALTSCGPSCSGSATVEIFTNQSCSTNGPSYTNSWTCFSRTNSQCILGEWIYIDYSLTNGPPIQVFPTGFFLPYASNITFCISYTNTLITSAQMDVLTCTQDTPITTDGTIHNDTVPGTPPGNGNQNTISGGGGGSPSDTYAPHPTNSIPNTDALLRAIQELLKALQGGAWGQPGIANDATLRAATNLLGQIFDRQVTSTAWWTNIAREGTLQGLTNLLASTAATLQSTMNSNAAQAHGDFQLWTNAYFGTNHAIYTNSVNTTNLLAQGHSISNALWTNLQTVIDTLATGTNIDAVASPSLWRIPTKTNIAGAMGFIDLNPRQLSFWNSLTSWTRTAIAWFVVMGTLGAIWWEGRKKLVEALSLVPGQGVIERTTNWLSHIASLGTTALLGGAVILGMLATFPAVVWLAIMPIINLLANLTGPFVASVIATTGPVAPYLREALSVTTDLVPWGAFTFCFIWYWVSMFYYDAWILIFGVIVRGMMV